MNLHRLLKQREERGAPLRVGLIGAGKFGSMYLSQVRHTPGVRITAIADLDPQLARDALKTVGWSDSSIATLRYFDDARRLIEEPDVEIVIDATGSPAAGIGHVLACCEHRKHIIMVNVEADALAGPLLAARAHDAGIVYSLWDMHDLLFEKQAEWSEFSVEDFETWLVERAAEVGLDTEPFKADMTDPATAALAQKAWDDGVAANLPGTPFLLLNGRYYNGPTDYNSMQSILQLIKLEDRQFSECPPMTIDPAKQYIATLKTEKGDIVIELYANAAPLAVNSFIFLAENGWFDGVTFHRVIPGFVAQAGDPTGTGYGWPGYAFDNEVCADFLHGMVPLGRVIEPSRMQHSISCARSIYHVGTMG